MANFDTFMDEFFICRLCRTMLRTEITFVEIRKELSLLVGGMATLTGEKNDGENIETFFVSHNNSLEQCQVDMPVKHNGNKSTDELFLC